MAKYAWIDQLQQLLGGKSTSNPSPELLHEPLQRSERFVSEMRHYQTHQEAEHRRLLRAHYEQSAEEPGSVPAFVLLQNSQASGFMWYAEAGVPEKHYDFLLDRLAEQLQDWGYSEKQNERKIWPVGEAWHEQHKRYLKPRLQAEAVASGQINQRFGNVLLEVLRRDGKLAYLKLQCNVYHDGQYLQAEGFGGLMERILGE